MDDWQKQWLKQIAKTSAEFDDFWVEVEEATESFVDEVSENISSFFEQFQSEFTEEVDSLIQDLVDVFVYTSEEIDSVLGEDWHDFSDDGNLLVCAMHPSGQEGDSCPDWEQNKQT